MVIINLFTLKLFSVIGCAVIAGAFLAFSTFIMNALSLIPPAQGIAAMQWTLAALLASILLLLAKPLT